MFGPSLPWASLAGKSAGWQARAPVAVDRMALTASGQVRYTQKTPYRDGTIHIVLEPLDQMARLAALVTYTSGMPRLRRYLNVRP